MYSTEMMMQLIAKIKGSIVLPDKSYFVRTNNSISMCYYVDGKQIYINLYNKQVAAQYLLDNGIVDSIKQDGDDVLLFRKSFYYTSNSKQVPVMNVHLVPVKWDEIKLTKKEVQQFAANDVWNRVSKGESSYGNTVYNPIIRNAKYDA